MLVALWPSSPKISCSTIARRSASIALSPRASRFSITIAIYRPKDIAENRQFRDLSEIWLEGDHYKWRAMRANGVDERYCTGDASPYEKFLAWAGTVPHTLRNPLYHWTHLELQRYFGIDELLDERSAPRVWERANALLATPELRAHGILQRFHVTHLCTTDDPADDLPCHRAIRASGPVHPRLSGVSSG